ncbi:MAG: hypothetical protein ACK58L_16450 [Planctomycetota bacterium]
MRLNRQALFLGLFCSLSVFAGCDEGSKPKNIATAPGHDHEHDHEHVYESVKDAVEELVALRNTIRDSFAKNDPDAAHDPLHEVGHILEAIPEQAKKDNLGAEPIAAMKASCDVLMDAFGAVDKTMHGQEGSSYSEVSAKIDAAVADLQKAAGLEVPTVEGSGEKAPEAAPASTEEAKPAEAPSAEAAPAADAAPPAEGAPK